MANTQPGPTVLPRTLVSSHLLCTQRNAVGPALGPVSEMGAPGWATRRWPSRGHGVAKTWLKSRKFKPEYPSQTNKFPG